MKTLLCFALVLFATPVFADPELVGLIFDSEKRGGGVIEFSILKLKAPEDMDGEAIPVKTDKFGRFAVKLARGNYRIGDIRKPTEKDARLFEGYYGRDMIEIGDALSYDAGIMVLEKVGSYVTGFVKQGRKPLAGAKVELYSAEMGVPTGPNATTNRDGSYELQITDIRDPQRVVLRVTQGESAQVFSSAQVDLWKPGKADLTIPDAFCELLVDLTAPGETRVYVHPAGDPAPYQMKRTKGSSKFAMPGLAPGTWTVTAVCNGSLTNVDVTLPATAPVAIVASPAARHAVSGHVEFKGTALDPEASLAVIAFPSGDAVSGYLWAPLVNGDFTFPGLAAGKYEIRVATGKSFAGMKYFSVKKSAIGMAALDLGQTRELKLDVKTSDLR